MLKRVINKKAGINLFLPLAILKLGEFEAKLF